MSLTLLRKSIQRNMLRIIQCRLNKGGILPDSAPPSLYFFIDSEEISCDFDLDAEPNYFFDHLANIEIDEDNQIEMGGING